MTLLRITQNGFYRGVQYQEYDDGTVDLFARQSGRLRSEPHLFTIDHPERFGERSLCQTIDVYWSAIKSVRKRSPYVLEPADDIPWEIHDIDDLATREIATLAYKANKL